jgi:UDPglucose 6-dehydrogenase
MADAGYRVCAVDPDPRVVAELEAGRPPIYEPGLDELLAHNAGRLRFAADPAGLAVARWAWIAFDTPVDDNDAADVEWVVDRAVRLLAPLPEGALVVVSSQLPVGSVARLRERCAAARGDGGLRFACIPENLRLGHALDSFRSPERIVAGVCDDADRRELAALLAPLAAEVLWMRVESAEMTKHALNGFLATSVAFMNEIAGVCETVGADATEVARALKSERRIGPGAYLQPGDAFAGGTLARDIGFLRELARRHDLPAHVFDGVGEGNEAHRLWTRRKLLAALCDPAAGVQPLAALCEQAVDVQPLAGRLVAVWGLTYKPGTDTLRRSNAVELCRWLTDAGARVRAHDPAVRALPADLALSVELCAEPLQAALEADALVVCTTWPDYRELAGEEIVAALGRRPLVLDPASWLHDALAERCEVEYLCVGTPPAVQRPGGAEASCAA